MANKAPTQESETYQGGFYLGRIGPWLPIALMVAGMVAATAVRGGIGAFCTVAMLAVFAAFALARDKAHFGRIVQTALSNQMLSAIVASFLLAGILSQALRQSGLVDALLWAMAAIHMPAALVPATSFVMALAISVSCGTTAGAITATAPVFVPLALQVGCDPGLMCGALIGGSVLGNALAPTSDVVIATSLTQSVSIGDAIAAASRPACVAGILTLLLLVLAPGGDAAGALATPAASGPAPLAMLLLPVLMVVLVRRGWGLVPSLIVCDITGCAALLALGQPLASLVSAEGPICAGMMGMLPIILYSMLLFILLEVLSSCHALESVARGALSLCRGPLSTRVVCMLAMALGVAVSGGSSPAVVLLGPVVARVGEACGLSRKDTSAIVSVTAVSVTGLLPYGTPCLLCMSFAASAGVGLGVADIIPHCTLCALALIATLALGAAWATLRHPVPSGG